MGQVILKPDPGRPQELYLGSLEALGIDTGAHDLRFVEDNWENPTLGAWGLGWEVWMDGEEPRRQQRCVFRTSTTSQPRPANLEITEPQQRLPHVLSYPAAANSTCRCMVHLYMLAGSACLAPSRRVAWQQLMACGCQVT